MRKLLGLSLLLAVFMLPTMAQESQTPPAQQPPSQSTSPSQQPAPGEETEPAKVKHVWEVSKHEVSGGFTYRQYYGPTATSVGMVGAYGSYQYNLRRWLGIEGEALGVNGSIKIPNLPRENLHVFTALAGPQIYPIGRHRLDPFGHFLYGGGFLITSVPAFSGFPSNTNTTVVKAWELGGGLDLAIKQRWAVRLIELDYVSAKFLGQGVPNQNGKRVSVGVVYRFGKR
jgi:hypothetical protein